MKKLKPYNEEEKKLILRFYEEPNQNLTEEDKTEILVKIFEIIEKINQKLKYKQEKIQISNLQQLTSPQTYLDLLLYVFTEDNQQLELKQLKNKKYTKQKKLQKIINWIFFQNGQINEIPHLTGEKIASSNLLSILFFWEILLQFIEFFEGIKRHKNPMYEREQKANQLLENERKKQINQNSNFHQKINIDQQILEYLQDIKQNHFKKSKQRVYNSERHQLIEQLQKKELTYQMQLESYQAELNKENLQVNQNLKQNNEYLKSKIRHEEVQTKELGEKIKVHNLSKYKQQSQILNFVINKAKKEDQYLDVVKNNSKQKKKYNEYVGEKLERQKEKKIMKKIEELSETLRENFKLQKSAYNQNFIQSSSQNVFSDLTDAPVQYIDTKQDDGKIWNLILDNLKKDYIFNKGTYDDSINKDKEKIQDNGIVTHHGYSLLNAKQLRYSGQQIKLLQLRNPWGKTSWKGDWDNSCSKID